MKYFLSEEVAQHNKRDDFWLVINKMVINLTPLLKDRNDDWNENLDYLLKFGGKDVSEFFHENGYPQLKICPYTRETQALFPPIIEEPRHPRLKNSGLLWCHDPMYQVGMISRRPRRVRVVNTVDWQQVMLKVCDEDNMAEIQRKYYEKVGVAESGNYSWRRLSHKNKTPVELRWTHTLDENGLIDFEGQSSQFPIPTLYLYPPQYVF